MNSKEIVKILLANGFTHKSTKGSHNKFINAVTGKICVVPHPKKHLPTGTVKSIEKQSGLKLR